MRVLAPESIDETLLDEVVDVLAVLDHQDDQAVFDPLQVVWVNVSLLDALSQHLIDFGIQISPVKTAHSLNRICHVVRSSHVYTAPAKSPDKQPPFLLNEVVEIELIVDQSPQIPYLRLALVLLVEFGSK